MSKFNEGDIIEGKVTGIESYGIFLSFDDGSSGLVHISEVSNDFVKDLKDYAKIGDTLSVKVLDMQDSEHYKLSLKALHDESDKKDSRLIRETKTGFDTLKIKLNDWVNEFDTKNQKKL